MTERSETILGNSVLTIMSRMGGAGWIAAMAILAAIFALVLNLLGDLPNMARC